MKIADVATTQLDARARAWPSRGLPPFASLASPVAPLVALLRRAAGRVVRESGRRELPDGGLEPAHLAPACARPPVRPGVRLNGAWIELEGRCAR